jgi:uncharacterized membrane protein YfcA
MFSGATGILSILLFFVALLYASVGQAGASGYLAAMAWAGVSPIVMRPTVLTLNVVVAAVGLIQFHQAGTLQLRGLLPYLALGLPMAVLGGSISLPPSTYEVVVGMLLLLAGAQTLRSSMDAGTVDQSGSNADHFSVGRVATGGGIGFIAGLSGMGGGVFLAPILLLARWASTREALGFSAGFNLLTSGAALAGIQGAWTNLSSSIGWWLLAVFSGGVLGAWIGSRFLSARRLRIILSVILLSSDAKLVLT